MTDTPASDTRLEELINLACNDQLDDTTRAELEQRLAESEPARGQYLDYFRLQTELHFLVSLDRCDGSVQEALEREPDPAHQTRLHRALEASWQFFSQPTPLSLSVAAAFIGLMITAMALLTPPVYRAMMRPHSVPYQPASRVVVGQLTAARQVVWADGAPDLRRGAKLSAGQRLELKNGLAEITFRSGAKVLLEGPATFDVTSHNAGQLLAGQITASVPSAAVGFVVHTSMARVVDLGTEFSLDIEATGSQRLYVFQGSVHVTGTGDEAAVLNQKVHAGEGISWTPTGHVRTLAGPKDDSYEKRAKAFRSDEVLLLAQSFDAADTDNFDGTSLAVRRSGRLAFETESRSAKTQQALRDGKLRMIMAGHSSGRLRFQHLGQLTWYDWAAGSAGEAIVQGGGLKIAFDWTPTSSTTSNWISFNIGHPGQDHGEPGRRVNHRETDYGILLRGNGETERYENGQGTTTGSFAAGPGPHHVVFDLAFNSLADGEAVGVTVTVGRQQVDHHLFSWDNNQGELYFELGTFETGMLIDNLRIGTFSESNPTPTRQP